MVPGVWEIGRKGPWDLKNKKYIFCPCVMVILQVWSLGSTLEKWQTQPLTLPKLHFWSLCEIKPSGPFYLTNPQTKPNPKHKQSTLYPGPTPSAQSTLNYIKRALTPFDPSNTAQTTHTVHHPHHHLKPPKPGGIPPPPHLSTSPPTPLTPPFHLTANPYPFNAIYTSFPSKPPFCPLFSSIQPQLA